VAPREAAKHVSKSGFADHGPAWRGTRPHRPDIPAKTSCQDQDAMPTHRAAIRSWEIETMTIEMDVKRAPRQGDA
jgi:hypothetical protein